MDFEKVVLNWIESAEDDIIVAEHLLDKGDYLYALFFGHLYKEHAPFSHDLEQLSHKLGIEFSENDIDALRRITLYNISARYPENREKIRQKFTQQYTREEFSKIKDIGQCLKRNLIS